MKKYVKKNRNRKGSVLLTVMCFTVVCMIIATTALSLAAYAAKQSNKNVKSTQAEISAQDYLEEFLKTFATYDDLEAMANTNTTVNVSMTSSSATPNVGNCSIQIKNKSTGILVTSTVDYAGETESVSAFFDGQAPSNFNSTNVIETNEGILGNDFALQAQGDVLAESSDITEVLYSHNNQSKTRGKFITQCNLLTGAGTTQTYYCESLDATPKAPVIISNGYMFWNSGIITSTVERKYDAADDADDTGYVLTNSKLLLLGSAGGNGQIGGTCSYNGETLGGNDIDVYCYGAYLGHVPTTVNDYLDIQAVAQADSSINLTATNGILDIHGNFYCYDGGTDKLNGDFYLWANGDTNIYGDLVVDGNIYINTNNGCKLNVYGNLYCTGNIITFNDDSVTALTTNSPTDLSSISSRIYVSGTAYTDLPSDDRSVMPTAYTSTSSKTSLYKTDGTLYDMYLANNADTDYIAAKYDFAYANNTLDCIYVDNDYNYNNTFQYALDNDASSWAAGAANYFSTKVPTLYIKDNCNLAALLPTLKSNYDNFDNVTIVIDVGAAGNDIVVLLPNDSKKLNIAVDFGIVNTSTNVSSNFCYFMVECGADASYYANDYCASSDYADYLLDPDNYSSYYGTLDLTETLIYDMNRFPNGAGDFNYQEAEANSIFILPPDNYKIVMKAQNDASVQAIIYSPQSDLSITGTGSQSRVFLGQAFVRTCETKENDAWVTRFLAAPDSILKFLDTLSSTNAIKLKYFTKRSN